MKKLSLLLAVVLLFSLCAACGGQEKPSNEELYAAAVEDAKTCKKNEISKLVELADSGNLLISWNSFPEEFPVGSTYIPRSDLEIWCISYEELQTWYSRNSKGVTDWTERLEQLIGLPEGFGYTHFTAFIADADDVIRPAYQPDPQKQVTKADLDGSALGEYAAWFEGNTQWSYVDSAWPWTRLGYTYDWAQGQERGLCEFLLLTGSEVGVEWTVTTEELIAMLAK